MTRTPCGDPSALHTVVDSRVHLLGPAGCQPRQPLSPVLVRRSPALCGLPKQGDLLGVWGPLTFSRLTAGTSLSTQPPQPVLSLKFCPGRMRQASAPGPSQHPCLPWTVSKALGHCPIPQQRLPYHLPSVPGLHKPSLPEDVIQKSPGAAGPPSFDPGPQDPFQTRTLALDLRWTP